MNKKIFSLLTCSVICIINLSSCAEEPIIKSHNQQTVIKLSWWGNDSRNEYTLKAVERFEKLHPDIKVNCSYSEWSGYEARSRVQMYSDTQADVMQINYNWLPEYSPDGNGYYDISTLADTVDLNNFTEDVLKYGIINDKLNAIPIAMNSLTVYVNKTIYDSYGLDVPETWDDFFKSAEVMRKDNIYPLSGALKSVWLYIITYTEQITGKTFLDKSGNLNFSKNDLQIMLEFYVKLINEKVIPQVEYFDKLNIDTGTYAGILAWSNDAVNYCGKAVENGYEMIVAEYTAVTPEKCGTGWYAKPATMYAISDNTEHPTESAMLLDFLLNSDDMALLQGIEKGIPLSESAKNCLESAGILTGIQYEASIKMENNKSMETLQPLLENESLIDIFAESCNMLLYERSKAEESAEKLYYSLVNGL
ncbi:MAG: ABC transporter substrate-binding protein [Ruminococcus sp.]|nr:ABC transporter substrate-binding protein [Ruminococcus sp.]